MVGTHLPGRRLPAEVVEQVGLTPFGFNPEEHPHPTAGDLKEHEQEYARFAFRKPCEAGDHAPKP